MGLRADRIRQSWEKVKSTQRFRDLLLFTIFVVISAIFWMIMSLNENVQTTFDINVNIYDTPDSVTFITEPPEKIQVTVRDKGTNLLRRGLMRGADLDVNFKEYASGGLLRYPKEALYTSLRRIFGSTAQISAVSVDSLKLAYTTNKGKRVPIVVETDVTASSGNVVAGNPILSQTYAYVYADKYILDTITRVYTKKIVKRNLAASAKEEAEIIGIKGVRIEPTTIKVDIPVEPLVSKTASCIVKVVNVPEGLSVLLFPEKIDVAYFVPMSRYNAVQNNIEVVADYAQSGHGRSGRLPVSVGKHPPYCINVKPMTDSLEYTIVR